MFLNLILPGQKTWKPYWVEIRDHFLDISTEYGKEAFTSFHIGVLKVKPSKEYPDRPDVLQFYDGDGLTSTNFGFHVFTYDPFDILEFFKAICASYKEWRETVEREMSPIQFQCDIKPPGFFSGNVEWKVSADRITIGKSGREETVILLKDQISVTPSSNPSHTAYFKYSTKANPDPGEHRCQTLDVMKKLLDAIYTNAYIIRKQQEGVAPVQGE